MAAVAQFGDPPLSLSLSLAIRKIPSGDWKKGGQKIVERERVVDGERREREREREKEWREEEEAKKIGSRSLRKLPPPLFFPLRWMDSAFLHSSTSSSPLLLCW